MSNEAIEDAPIETQEPVENQVQEADAEGIEEEADQAEKSSDSSTDKKVVTAVQKRIDELTKKYRQQEREAQYWREQFEKNQKPVEAHKQPEPEISKTLADFNYDEHAYQKYLFDEAQKSAVEAAKRELKQEREREQARSKANEFGARESEYSKEAKDYIQVTRNPELKINQSMVEIVSDMDEGPAVLYYLGKNPDIAESISYLSPLQAARELGRIEAKLGEKKVNAISSAPPPAAKIDAVAPATRVTADSPESDKLPVDEWLKRRNKQLKR